MSCAVGRVLLLLLLYCAICWSFKLPRLPRGRIQLYNAPLNQVPPTTDRVLIAGETHVRPLDYVAHPTYGIGKYIRSQGIFIGHSESGEPKYAPGMVVRFQDGDVLWFQRNAIELYLFKLAQAGEQALSSLVNFAKWNTRVKKAERDSEEIARNLIETQRVRSQSSRPTYLPDSAAYQEFEAAFPYPPTVDQQACFDDIAFDMINVTTPMDRLVIGDVGFGKTEIAMRTAYRAVLSGRQVAVLAPTRVLVGQHLQNFIARMPNVNIQILRGASAGQSQALKRTKQDLKDGTCQIVIGTHAILSENLKFHNLALLIIDEEHKFGVIHKEQIKQKFHMLDVLTLSATPIPRTLQISLQGMRKTSMMKTPPMNRKAVEVGLISDKFEYPAVNETTNGEGSRRGRKKAKLELEQAKEGMPNEGDPDEKSKKSKVPKMRTLGEIAEIEETTAHMVRVIQKELDRGGQVFAVVPFVKDMEAIEKRLLAAMKNITLIKVHGKVKDMEAHLDLFKQKEANVLLATTVIENGIDMPNVNTILVFRAELFGMSALYQLKGRVGRCDKQAYAYFYYLPKVGEGANGENERLYSLKAHNQLGAGMEVAKDDLRNRGCGNLEGEEQAGTMFVGHAMQAAMIASAVQTQLKDTGRAPTAGTSAAAQDQQLRQQSRGK